MLSMEAANMYKDGHGLIFGYESTMGPSRVYAKKSEDRCENDQAGQCVCPITYKWLGYP